MTEKEKMLCGELVTRNISASATVMGNPARIKEMR